MIFEKIILKLASKINAHNLVKKRKIAYKKNKEDFDNNQKLNNSCSGRCFILGNGPSAKNVDFSLLQNEDVFVVNLFAKYPNYKILRPKYYVVVDPFLLSADEANKDRIEKIAEVGKNNLDIQYFLPVGIKQNYIYAKIKENNVVHLLNPTNRICNSLDNAPLLNKPTPDFGNVILHSIYIAICMGYKKIYLLGCDETSILTIINAHIGFVDDSAYAYPLSEETKKKIIEDSTKLPFEKSLYQVTETFKDFALIKEYGEKSI